MRDDLGMVLDHRISGTPARHQLSLTTQGEPGSGGAHRLYVISSVNGGADTGLVFQEGAIPSVGINGITNEVLLAVVIDRLRDFQAGEFSCRENALALTNLEQSMMWLHKRTYDRISRGVEGTYEK